MQSDSSIVSNTSKNVIAPDLHKLSTNKYSFKTQEMYKNTPVPPQKSTPKQPPKTTPQTTDSDLPITTSPQKIYLTDIPSLQKLYPRISDLITPSLASPELFAPSSPPKGILLTGPSGTGKTALAHAVANEILTKITANFISVSASSLISSKTGDTERQIRDIFSLGATQKTLILIDQIESIASFSSSSQREFERRIVAQICNSLDESAGIFVIATAQEAGRIDKNLRRPGRFDVEIEVPIPNRQEREMIIEKIGGRWLDGEQVSQLARNTPGFVPADLRALHRESVIFAWKNHIQVDFRCFMEAVKLIQPISRREGLATVPDISLDDIGGLEKIKQELNLWVLKPIQNPEFYKKIGLQTSAGVILYGAPGNGKTLLGKALANQAECNFISVKGPELLNQYVGESEKAVRQLFEKARSARPVIVFLDECECLCRQRGSGSNSEVTDRVVNQFLTELDGVCSDREGIFVVAATNRVDLLDKAIMRPGRLEKAIYVPLPNLAERVDILKKLTGKCTLNDDVSESILEQICGTLKGFSGADLQSVVREGGLNCVSRQGDEICAEDLILGAKKVRRSVSEEDLVYYKSQQEAMQ